MVDVWMGDLPYRKAVSQDLLKVVGPRALTRNIFSWINISMFADLPPTEKSSEGLEGRNVMLYRWILFLLLLVPCNSFAEIHFSSPIKQTTFLELYTSEGCSSCPPADRWLSSLKDDPRLWNEIVPVAFHVDYWNYLGWKDEFSRAEYSERQRNYARWNNLSTVYTPGFLQNGKEWRGWFRSNQLNATLGPKVGQLTVSIDHDRVLARYKPVDVIGDSLYLNVAWLGFDLKTRVKAGENEGKTLPHDFVSYNTNMIKGSVDKDAYTWEFKTNVANLPEKKGVAFWVTRGKDPTPVQATGGWLQGALVD